MMHDLYSLLSIILIVSPIVIGIGFFLGQWFVEEFYRDELYPHEEEGQEA